MWCYYIENKLTLEADCIFGYSFKDACKRERLNPLEWRVVAEVWED